MSIVRKGSVDFKSIGASALASIESLLDQWLPGGKNSGSGNWLTKNPVRNESNASLSISLATGAWHDFASDDKGGDLISLYAYIHGLSQSAAAAELGRNFGLSPGEAVDRPVRAVEIAKPVPKESPWLPIVPVDLAIAGPYPVAHEIRGRPDRTWEYRDALGGFVGVICRFTTSTGGKEILPLVFAENRKNGKKAWRWMAFPSPRPLYGVELLRKGVTKLVVEGEKCAEIGRLHLSETLDVLTWPGGCKAVAKADWSTLAGENVLIWPDADAKCDRHGVLKPKDKQPGMAAAIEIAKALVLAGCNVRILDVPAPGEKKDGWDLADAVEDGVTGADLRDYVKSLVPKVSLSQVVDGAAGEPPAPPRSGGGHDEPPGDPEWFSKLLRKKGEIVPCASNVLDILANHGSWKGVLAYDEFSMRVVKQLQTPFENAARSAAEDWTDGDDSETAIWITKVYGFSIGSNVVKEAVDVLSKRNGYHPVREYLESLPPWDGECRLDTWLERYLNVEQTQYTKLVSRWFLMGMVQRALKPGCKFDYCLVLEGIQGRQKSSALAVLASREFFSDAELDLSNKDSMSNIRGKWLHEFGEMGSLARADSSRQKSFLTRQIDEFRPAYGRREIKCPRQIAFAGTTNEDFWNKDPTGARRFWPIFVPNQIDLVGLGECRDLLFAEALDRVRADERFWPTADEQRELFDPEQRKREEPNPFVELLERWMESDSLFWQTHTEFAMSDALSEGLRLDAGKMTRDVTTRVGIAIAKLGCERIERRNSAVRFVYKRPAKKDALVTADSAQVEERDDLPF